MKVLHLKCTINPHTKRRRGVTPVEGKENTYYSCCWNFPLDKSKELIGGMIFFHDTKKDKSGLGGIVTDVHPVHMDDPETQKYVDPIDESDDPKRKERVMFEFRITKEGREQKWRGRDDINSWTSGIIDVDG